MPKKHSAVCYIYERDGGFKPVQKAHTVKNDLGVDLFAYHKALYEGQTGLRVNNTVDLSALKERIERIGGMERLKQIIEDNIKRNGLSPRYSRPDEKIQDIFPKDENLVFATEASGEKHYYFRLYNENGIELFTRNNDKEFFATVYVKCNGYMLGFDQKHRLDEIVKRLPALEGGIYGEVERNFNAAMENPNRYADLGFARILNRMDEAKAHNAPILERREAEYKQRQNDRTEQERRDKEAAEQRYTQAIEKAEKALLAGETVANPQINGKSLALQLFREHNIDVPLRTQGWVNQSLKQFSFNGEKRSYTIRSTRKSKAFSDCACRLYDAVLTKQQFLENENTEEEENDVETEQCEDNGIEP